jgi:hypothetical protein
MNPKILTFIMTENHDFDMSHTATAVEVPRSVTNTAAAAGQLLCVGAIVTTVVHKLRLGMLPFA